MILRNRCKITEILQALSGTTEWYNVPYANCSDCSYDVLDEITPWQTKMTRAQIPVESYSQRVPWVNIMANLSYSTPQIPTGPPWQWFGQRNKFCRAQGLPEDPFCSLDHNPVPSMPADGIRKGLGVTHQVCRPEKGALPRKTTWFCLKSVALQFDAWSARLSPVHRP